MVELSSVGFWEEMEALFVADGSASESLSDIESSSESSTIGKLVLFDKLHRKVQTRNKSVMKLKVNLMECRTFNKY